MYLKAFWTGCQWFSLLKPHQNVSSPCSSVISVSTRFGQFSFILTKFLDCCLTWTILVLRLCGIMSKINRITCPFNLKLACSQTRRIWSVTQSISIQSWFCDISDSFIAMWSCIFVAHQNRLSLNHNLPNEEFRNSKLCLTVFVLLAIVCLSSFLSFFFFLILPYIQTAAAFMIWMCHYILFRYVVAGKWKEIIQGDAYIINMAHWEIMCLSAMVKVVFSLFSNTLYLLLVTA